MIRFFTTTLLFGLICNFISFAQWQRVIVSLNTPVLTICTDNNNVICGSNAGMYFSTNNGYVWNGRNLTGLTSTFVKAIAVRDGNIFVGTKSNGVFLSTDFGSNWVEKNTGLTNLEIKSLTISGNTIFAGTNKGIFLSTDNGSNWFEAKLTSKYSVYSFAVGGTNIYAGTYRGILYSSDNGINWTYLSIGGMDQVSTIAIKDQYIIAGFQGLVGSGMCISVDNGKTWKTKNNGLGADIIVYSMSIIGDNIFIATSSGIYQSVDNADTWKKILNIGSAQAVGISGNNILAAVSSSLYIASLSAFGITGVEENSFESTFSIHPNPIVGSLKVSFETPIEIEIEVSIEDIIGLKVKSVTIPKGTKHWNMDVEDLSSGMYFLRYKNYIKKFIKY